MQQTEKYKLNLIESSDPFLPDGLNQNTLRLEQVVSQHLEDMDQRVTVLEARHFAYGSYPGTHSPSSAQFTTQFIPLPFKPKAVFTDVPAPYNTNEYSAFSVDLEGGEHPYLQLLDNGFMVKGRPNNIGINHNFIAFG